MRRFAARGSANEKRRPNVLLQHQPRRAGGPAHARARAALASVRHERVLREKPNFFDVDVYGTAAESVSNYMRRGSRVGIDGRLEWREWETAEHGKRQAVSIVADTVQFLDSARGEREGDEEADGELAGVGA